REIYTAIFENAPAVESVVISRQDETRARILDSCATQGGGPHQARRDARYYFRRSRRTLGRGQGSHASRRTGAGRVLGAARLGCRGGRRDRARRRGDGDLGAGGAGRGTGAPAGAAAGVAPARPGDFRAG